MITEAKKHTYPNGLTLIVDEAPELKSVAIGAWVKTGSRHEAPELSGVCHFLEHMIFKGGNRMNSADISRAVDRVGGDFNAFTSREHTCFHFYLPAQEVELGATLLKEVLFEPKFETKEIEKERQVILQEIAMTEDNHEEDAYDQFLEKCFDPHPLGRNILGTKKTVSSLKRKEILGFFLNHYRPENMLISVSGAIQFKKAKKMFSSLGTRPWPKRAAKKVEPQTWGATPPSGLNSGFTWVDKASEQTHVIYGIQAPVKNQKERLASTLVQHHLGGGMSSVLFDQIREKRGWAYSVYANAIQFLDASVFSIYAGVQSDRVDESIQVYERELARIAKHGIPLSDLKRIKDSLKYSFRLSLESSDSRMMSISSAELYFKRGISLLAFEKALSEIRSSDIQQLIASWLKNSGRSILVLGAKPKNGRAWRELNQLSSRLTGSPVSLIKKK